MFTIRSRISRANNVGGLANAADCQGSKNLRSRLACFGQAMDVRLIIGTLADGLVKNGWMGRDTDTASDLPVCRNAEGCASTDPARYSGEMGVIALSGEVIVQPPRR